MAETTDPGCFPPTAVSGGGPYRSSSGLPLGRWHVMSNGRIHYLEINSVSGSSVVGLYNGEPLVFGRWDGTFRTLTFIRLIPDVGLDAPLIQSFTGHLMDFQDWDSKWRIAGSIEQYSPRIHDPHAGWYATLSKKED